jgi:hypothetical protein
LLQISTFKVNLNVCHCKVFLQATTALDSLRTKCGTETCFNCFVTCTQRFRINIARAVLKVRDACVAAAAAAAAVAAAAVRPFVAL